MKKQNTLRKNWEFQAVISQKDQMVSEYLIFYYQKSSQAMRVGISISKKFAIAVQRNRQRRQVRAILDEVNFWKMNYDVIIILRKKFLSLPFEDKKKHIKNMFERFRCKIKKDQATTIDSGAIKKTRRMT